MNEEEKEDPEVRLLNASCLPRDLMSNLYTKGFWVLQIPKIRVKWRIYMKDENRGSYKSAFQSICVHSDIKADKKNILCTSP